MASTDETLNSELQARSEFQHNSTCRSALTLTEESFPDRSCRPKPRRTEPCCVSPSCAISRSRRTSAGMSPDGYRTMHNASAEASSIRTPSLSNRALQRGFAQVKPCDVLETANSSSTIGGGGDFSGGLTVEQTLLNPPTSSVSAPATVS